MTSAFFIDFFEPTSDFQTTITFLFVDKNTKCGYIFSQLDCKEHLGHEIVRFWKKQKHFASVVSFLEDRYIMQSSNMTSFVIMCDVCRKCKKSITHLNCILW